MFAWQRPMTLEEFLELPEEKPALEYVNGVVTQKMSGTGGHSALMGEIATLIGTVGRTTRSVMAFICLTTVYDGCALVPDVSAYRWERIPRGPDGRLANGYGAQPDLAVEIASPGEERDAIRERCRWYIEHGVQVALLVDPDSETIEDFRRGVAPVRLLRSDRLDLTLIAPNLVYPLDTIFDALTF